ncbi:MAG: S1C family serine protease [Christensenellales bacterium]|jgi:serine protease Do
MKITRLLVISLLLICVITLGSCGKEIISAYDIAVKNGFSGTEAEWLESLKGKKGLSAYEIAVSNGFNGTEEEWLESLKGTKGDTGNTSDIAAVNYAINSVVCVYADSSAGAGVIISDNKEEGDAYIITNYHVVYSAQDGISEDIGVYLYGTDRKDMSLPQDKIPVQYIGGSMQYDIAVLKINDSDLYKNSSAYPAVIRRGDVYPGTKAIAIGNPQATGISATIGIVSVDSEYIEMTAADNLTKVSFRVVRIDTAVNSGNSGGGLFNGKGELIGIVNAKIILYNIENIAYAIPTDVALNVAENIIRNCEGSENDKVLRCMVGVSLGLEESCAVYNSESGLTDIIQTVSVQSVSEGSIADGHIMVGDIIKSIVYESETVNVTRIYKIVDYSLKFEQGKTFELNILRDGVEMQVTLTLQAPVTVP